METSKVSRRELFGQYYHAFVRLQVNNRFKNEIPHGEINIEARISKAFKDVQQHNTIIPFNILKKYLTGT